MLSAKKNPSRTVQNQRKVYSSIGSATQQFQTSFGIVLNRICVKTLKIGCRVGSRSSRSSFRQSYSVLPKPRLQDVKCEASTSGVSYLKPYGAVTRQVQPRTGSGKFLAVLFRRGTTLWLCFISEVPPMRSVRPTKVLSVPFKKNNNNKKKVFVNKTHPRPDLVLHVRAFKTKPSTSAVSHSERV